MVEVKKLREDLEEAKRHYIASRESLNGFMDANIHLRSEMLKLNETIQLYLNQIKTQAGRITELEAENAKLNIYADNLTKPDLFGEAS
jgi:chromosome segregation ATPase